MDKFYKISVKLIKKFIYNLGHPITGVTWPPFLELDFKIRNQFIVKPNLRKSKLLMFTNL